MDLLIRVIGILCATNALSYGLFAWDKHQARSYGWRIPERTLLLFALLGGSAGAKLAQRRFGHKTRKEPFRTQLNLIVALHVVGIAVMLYPPARLAASEALSGLFAPEEAARITPRRFGPGSD